MHECRKNFVAADEEQGMENKTYSVSLKSKSIPHKLQAASVKKDNAEIVFTNAEGEEVGRFREKDVMGYSVEPEDDLPMPPDPR